MPEVSCVLELLEAVPEAAAGAGTSPPTGVVPGAGFAVEFGEFAVEAVEAELLPFDDVPEAGCAEEVLEGVVLDPVVCASSANVIISAKAISARILAP